MPPSYRVFLGAPAISDLQSTFNSTPSSYHWHTVSLTPTPSVNTPLELELPPASFNEASERLSAVYKGVIFGDESEDSLDASDDWVEADSRRNITWSKSGDISKNASADESRIDAASTSNVLDVSELRSGRQETQSSADVTADTTNYAEDASIARFPTYRLNIKSLSSLSVLLLSKHSVESRTTKVNVLVAVLEVDGPDMIRIKKGPDAGSEVAMLKLIVGDEDSGITKITAWRETAEIWSGYADTPAVRKGDVVLLNNILFAHATPLEPGSATASPKLGSNLTLCYRTLPTTKSDRNYRPDLRLNDATIRRVASVVRWVSRMAGLPQG